MRTLIRLSIPLLLAAFAWAAAPNGTYKGSWSGDNGGGGDLTVTFMPTADSTPKAEVSFTTGDGTPVKTTMKSVDVDGTAVKLVFEFDVESGRMQATVTGTQDGNTMHGQYTTKSLEDGSETDEGTWKVTAS